MVIKVFKFNNSGKVEFTQVELEKLLNEVYNSGYTDGRNSKDYTWTSPNWTYLNSTPRYANDTTTNTATNIGPTSDEGKSNYDAMNDM